MYREFVCLLVFCAIKCNFIVRSLISRYLVLRNKGHKKKKEPYTSKWNKTRFSANRYIIGLAKAKTEIENSYTKYSPPS